MTGQRPDPDHPGARGELGPAEQRAWAVAAHLGALVLLFLAPLLVWLLLRDRGRYVAEQAAEALNFQILAVLTAAAVTLLSVVTFGLAALLFLPLIGAWLVLVVLATVAVGRGQHHRYPVSWRIVR